MQNGTLGEARTRAFLANRFWVLERSVDVHGADFLIQINSLASSVLDDKPPRFAIIQSKFVQSGATSIRIPPSYLQRNDGSLSPEFFLIICSGYGDDERMFLLSASDVDAEFDTTISKKNGKLTRTKKASHFLDGTNYEITGARNDALNRIERALRGAGFSENRFWLTSLGYGRGKPPELDSNYYYPVLGIEDLPWVFKRWKRETTEALYEIEEIASYLQDSLAARTPADVRAAADNLHPHINLDGRFSIEAPGNMEDFVNAAEFHDRLMSGLKNANVEGAWRSLAERGQSLTLDALQNNLPKSSQEGLHFTVDFDPKSLHVHGFKAVQEKQFCGGREAWFVHPNDSPGHAEVCVRADIAHLTVDRATYETDLTHALSVAILPTFLGVADIYDI